MKRRPFLHFDSMKRTFADRRLRPVLITFAVAVGATIAVALLTHRLLLVQLQWIYISFLSSWIEDLVFFAVVGSVVWYVALRRPEEEDFDQRVKFLYGGRLPDSILEYNQDRIKKLGGYSPHAERTVIIERYDSKARAYLTSITTKYTIKNSLDINFTDEFSIGISPDVSDDLPEEVGRIKSIKMGDDPDLIKQHSPITKSEGFKTSAQISLEKYEEKEFCAQYEIWLLIGPQFKSNMRPQRAVATFHMKILSQCADNVNPRIKRNGEIITLLPNEPHEFQPVSGVKPHETIFEFEFVEPSDRARSMGEAAEAAKGVCAPAS